MTILCHWNQAAAGHQSFGGVNSSKERGNYIIAFHVLMSAADDKASRIR